MTSPIKENTTVAKQHKIQRFEYLLTCLVKWHSDLNKCDFSTSCLSFNRLKVMKLLFFTSAVKANSTSNGLLDMFNNFYALPYGHVESDIYNSLRNKELNHYSIENTSISISKEDPEKALENELPEKDRILIEDSIKELRDKNQNLVNYESFQLVDLSHKWNSWQEVFQRAQAEGKLSLPIPTFLIASEPKFYSL